MREMCKHKVDTAVSGDPTGSSEAEMALQWHPQSKQEGQDLRPCNDHYRVPAAPEDRI